jgi:hypothetical protein
MGILKQVAEYLYLKKKDPNAPRTQWMKYMHGINRLSIFLFLLAMIILAVTGWESKIINAFCRIGRCMAALF